MRYRSRLTGVIVTTDTPLGHPYERLHEDEDCWCEPTSETVKPKPRTVAATLAAVGDDPDRARAALAFEAKQTKPRVTLIRSLEELAG